MIKERVVVLTKRSQLGDKREGFGHSQPKRIEMEEETKLKECGNLKRRAAPNQKFTFPLVPISLKGAKMK